MDRYRVNLNGQQTEGPFPGVKDAQGWLDRLRAANNGAPGPRAAWIERRTTGSADEPGEWVRVRDSKARR